MLKSAFYKFSRIFWSIYFVISIALIGLIFGYLLTFALYFTAWIVSLFYVRPARRLSDFIRYGAEYVQCFSIRMLLRLQPWLHCQTNLPHIYGFYDQFKTRRVLFVANHRSSLDTFFLISYIPGLRGLAKSSLYYNIFFAPFMIVAGFMPVKKGSADSFLEGLKLLKTKLLQRDRAVLFFPENTRCAKGFPSVAKFGSSIFQNAIDSDAVVVPLVMKKTDRVMGRGEYLLHPFEPIEIEMLEAIDAKNFQDGQTLRDVVWDKTRLALHAL